MGFLGGGSSNSGDSSGGSPGQMSKAKKQSKKNTGGGSIAMQVVKAVGQKLEEASRPYNTKVRKEYIQKYNTRVPPSERINMSDEQIGSREGLASLRELGYKTNQDIIAGGGNQGGTQIAKPILGSDIQKTAVKDAPDGPTIGEMDQLEETEAERLAKIKRRGRKSTRLSATDDDELTLSKKTLLG